MTIRWCKIEDAALLTLTRELDAHLRASLGERQTAFDGFNSLAQLDYAAIFSDGQNDIACGALKLHGDGVAEIKRVFVRPPYRRMGAAQQLLAALEAQAKAVGCTALVLETNPSFEPAVTLYRRFGFAPIPAFGVYQGMDTLCMGKTIG